MLEPAVEIAVISERRAESRRVHESVTAASLLRIREVLMSAKRAGRGVGSAPERDAKTEEMSPSLRARSRSWGAIPVAVARFRR